LEDSFALLEQIVKTNHDRLLHALGQAVGFVKNIEIPPEARNSMVSLRFLSEMHGGFGHTFWNRVEAFRKIRVGAKCGTFGT
jgi:hypothetical protein